MADLLFDPARSTVRVRTYAEGFFSKLAHDVEFLCEGVSGRASGVTEEDVAGGSASLEFPIGRIAIAGVLDGDRVDTAKLSGWERSEIVAKMQRDVFRATSAAVLRVAVAMEGSRAKLRVEPPVGGPVEIITTPTIQRDGAGVRAKGRAELSLSKLGSAVVRGPMNAFRMKDVVEIHFDVGFYPA